MVVVVVRGKGVIADLEEEKRRHAEDTAEGDDVTYILEKQRERLQQQLDFERGQARRAEQEQRRLAEQLDEERAQRQQEKEAWQALQEELHEERRRALRMEARVEEQLAEFDTEREQLRARLKKEEAHCCHLQQEVEELRRQLEEASPRGGAGEERLGSMDSGRREQCATRMETATAEDTQEADKLNVPAVQPGVNGHHDDQEGDGPHSPSGVLPDPSCPAGTLGEDCDVATTPSPTTSSSPPPTSRPPPGSPGSPGTFQSSYQAGINQRFHAARHKFQGTVDPDLQPAAASSSPAQAAQPSVSAPAPSARDPAPGPAPIVSPEASPVKQLARSTVTQVLSRFTTAQQGVAATKPAAPNNSPFGTDYRNLSAPLSPVIGRAQGGVRSPTIPRAERGNPPPIPPKKPGLAQAPASPALATRSVALYSDSPISGSCGLTSSQEGVKELDMVVSSN
ncbi:hypothetical protein CRUP_029532 [Coryphaenoides rupestris]|nr:hypothetical protein CRUP_029532 [Coryphaenoides rupestris]